MKINENCPKSNSNLTFLGLNVCLQFSLVALPISLIFGLVGFSGLTRGGVLLTNLGDVVETFKDVHGFSFSEGVSYDWFIFFEAVFDVSLYKEMVWIVFDFGSDLIILEIDFAGGNDLKEETLLFGITLEVRMVSGTGAAHDLFYYFGPLSLYWI